MCKRVLYQVAKEKYESVKPIRSTTIRPIGNRRRKHEHMEMLSNGDIQFICYHTPVITVHKDDSFSVAHGGYVTTTTSNFLRWVLNYVFTTKYPYMSSWKHDNQLWLVQGGREDGKRMPLTKDPVRYAYNPDTDRYQPSAPVVVKKHRTRTNSEKSKHAYEQCKDLLDWLKSFSKLLDGEVMEVEGIWGYQEAYYIRNPVELSPKFTNRWPNTEETYKARREWLLETLTGDAPERFILLLVNVCSGDGHYAPKPDSLYDVHVTIKKARPKILHLIKCAFDCYEDYVADVEYEFNRKSMY